MKEILARLKATIFDLDGTPVDSNELHVESHALVLTDRPAT
jgi:beta-phosphoglucomutase-like phosphatase (HAD superfamily)